MFNAIEEKKRLMELKAEYLDVLIVVVKLMRRLPQGESLKFLEDQYEYFDRVIKDLEQQILNVEKTRKFIPHNPKQKKEIEEKERQFRSRTIIPDGVNIPQGIQDLL